MTTKTIPITLLSALLLAGTLLGGCANPPDSDSEPDPWPSSATSRSPTQATSNTPAPLARLTIQAIFNATSIRGSQSGMDRPEDRALDAPAGTPASGAELLLYLRPIEDGPSSNWTAYDEGCPSSPSRPYGATHREFDCKGVEAKSEVVLPPPILREGDVEGVGREVRYVFPPNGTITLLFIERMNINPETTGPYSNETLRLAADPSACKYSPVYHDARDRLDRYPHGGALSFRPGAQTMDVIGDGWMTLEWVGVCSAPPAGVY